MLDTEKYYTVKELCEILHKDRRTIYAYIKSKQLKASKAGGKSYLIAESDLKAFIDKGVEPGYFQKLYPRPHKSENI